MNFIGWLKKYEVEVVAAVLLLAVGFTTGYFAHKRWSEPITRTVTVNVPVKVGEDPKPQINHPNNVLTPEIRYVTVKEQPQAPTEPQAQLQKPDLTTVIHVPVPQPMKLDIFHQSEIKWKKEEKNLRVWVDSRIWTLDENGKTIPGVTATTSYSQDAQTNIPIDVQVPMPKNRVWSAGLTYGVRPGERGYGGFVDRDLGPIRLGVEATQFKSGTVFGLRAGVRF